MRVVCDTIEDFLVNLNQTDVAVYRGVLYYQKTERPMGNKPAKDAHKFEVFYSVSAIVDLADGQQMIEAAEICGEDVRTSDGTAEGTARQDVLHNKILEFCKTNRLRALPGSLDI